ncbi:hypothetical protein PUN28_010158 [Cardiocondyla obscurior]|uniref:Uncharacterized protein n=1 Tax=Cardiocondyla obscurior TaxID=286306 RepID=A0AAW2FMD4_9HYME
MDFHSSFRITFVPDNILTPGPPLIIPSLRHRKNFPREISWEKERGNLLVFRGVPQRKEENGEGRKVKLRSVKDATELTNKTARSTYNVAEGTTRIRSNEIKAVSGAGMTSFPDPFPDLG